MKPLWNLAEAKAERIRIEAEEKRIADLARNNWAPDGKTVLSPVKGRRITTPYKKKPNNNTYWQTRGYHTGADWACDNGTDLLAVVDGVLDHLNDAVLGNVVLLYGEDGYTYWYCHCSGRVTDGKRVKRNDKVGNAGATGSGANGPHLHLEKRRGHTRSWSGPDLNPTW